MSLPAPLPARASLAQRLTLPPRLLHRALRYRWKLNRIEIRAMCERLHPGGVAIDVGAHKGGYTAWMAHRVGPRGRVLAFEPQMRVAGPTAASLAAAGLSSARVYAAAVSDTSGIARLAFVPSTAHGATLNGLDLPEAQSMDVPTVALDDIVEEDRVPRLDFVKIDVEGHEMSVLRGLSRSIDRFHPPLLVEIEARLHESGDDPIEDARALLAPKGYEAFFFTRDRMLPLSEFRARDHQTYGQGYYSNNFLFEVAR